MILSDDVKDESNDNQKNVAKLPQGQDPEKSGKTTGSPYLMPYHNDRELKRKPQTVEKSKTQMKRQMAHKRPLTKREEEIVRLISGGLRNKEVAKALGISVKTVETHRVNIMNKLALQNLAQLIRYAVQKGLIHIEVEK